VEMKRDSSLLDANFSGYKLSLDALHVARNELADGPVHLQPAPEMYGLLHAKVFGEHNHLFLDNFNEDRVYFISGKGKIYTINEAGCPSEVWNIPETGQAHDYNPGLVFASESLALVSDGSGTLFIVETGDRQNECMWKSVFQDAVCGKERPFVVRYGCVQDKGANLEVVLQFVEDPEKLDVIGLPTKPEGAETSFFNCLEWISFSKQEKGWQMERVRRVVSHGGFNYISITDGNLATSAEKKTILSFDSLHPVESLETEPMHHEQEEKPKFYWKQTHEDVEIWFYVLPDTIKSHVDINVPGEGIHVKISGLDLIKGEFHSKVEKDSWTWTIDHGKIGVMMSKQTPGMWTSFWADRAGPAGQEVTDMTEDTILPHLTTENPICTEDPTREPAFNTQELESVDDTMDHNSNFIWQSDAGKQSITSLHGNQHLMSISVQNGCPPALCIRSDVDGIVLKVEDNKLEHVCTFPALGYVQAGKQNRKFLTAPHDFSYSAICDDSRHIYVYRQPKPIDSELKNRKTGVKVAGIAVQQVVTLDNREEILGMQATPNLLFIVSQHAVYRIAVK